MKTQIINGVPYLINDKGEVFVYSSVPPIPSGSYASDTKILSLSEDWEQRMSDWVAYYRNGLKQETDDALEKAKQLQIS
jgi:hypothetical protein